MEARATLRGSRMGTGVVVKVTTALLAAFLLGGASGYFVGALSLHASSAISTPIETVQQQQPEPQQTFLPQGYTLPGSQPTAPLQTLDPKGYTIQF
jgi:hypothetical protein